MVVERLARERIVEQRIVVEPVMVPYRRLGALSGLARRACTVTVLRCGGVFGLPGKIGFRHAGLRNLRFGRLGVFRRRDSENLVRRLPVIEPGRPQKIAWLEIAPVGKQGQLPVRERSMLLPLPAQIPSRFRELRVILAHACIPHRPPPKPKKQMRALASPAIRRRGLKVTPRNPRAEVSTCAQGYWAAKWTPRRRPHA